MARRCDEMANVMRGLYIGSADAASDVDMLIKKKIKSVINICGYDTNDHKPPKKS